EHSFIFTGGIIMIANKPLADLPESLAMKTRITCTHLRATDAERIALMRSVALRGFHHEGRSIEPAACLEVCEFLIDQSRSLPRPLGMRMLINSLLDFLAWEECEVGCHWRDMVATRIKERPISFEVEPDLGAQAERKRRDVEIAREVAATTTGRKERVR